MKKNKNLLLVSAGVVIGVLLGNVWNIKRLSEIKEYKQKLKNSEKYNKDLETALIKTKMSLANISDKLWLAENTYHKHFKNYDFNYSNEVESIKKYNS